MNKITFIEYCIENNLGDWGMCTDIFYKHIDFPFAYMVMGGIIGALVAVIIGIMSSK